MLKIKTLLATLVLASVAFLAPAQAATVVTNTTDQLLNAVGETTSTLTVAPFVEMTIFVSGTYSVANDVVLQREKGSPGSGVFADVATLDLSTANARTVLTFANGPNTNGYRLLMRTFGTGAVVAYLTDWSRTGTTYTRASHVEWYHDFETTLWETNADSQTLLQDQVYEMIGGTDNSGAIAIIDESNREGAVVQVSSTDENDQECFGAQLIANEGSLISDGITIFETRFQVDVLTAGFGMQISDQQCSATAVNWTVVGTTVTAPVANTDGAAFFLNDAATDTTGMMAVSAIDAVEGANALPVRVNVYTAVLYDVYRIEIDALGNAYWYFNGVLVHAEPLAVTPTIEMIWSVFAESSSAGSTALLQTIDYILWVRPRPSLAST